MEAGGVRGASIEEDRIETGSGVRCAATVYRPQDLQGPLPCVVMGAGATLTRRDGISDYAERFALDHVDRGRIVTWGMSLGGGHAVMTAAVDSRIARSCGRADGRRPRLLADRSSHAGPVAGNARFDAEPDGHPPRGRSARVGPALQRAGGLSGFERVAMPNGWRNEVTFARGTPLAAYRPVRRARKVRAPVLVRLGEHDAIAPPGPIEKTAARAPSGELRRYPIDHFGCFSAEHIDRVAGDQLDFLRRQLGAGAPSPSCSS